MKKFSTVKTTFILLSMMTFASASGAIGGTLAWYAYTTRANVSYSGTSVNETSLLEIGICSDVEIEGMPSYITKVTYPGDSKKYYFADPGRGLTYDVISKYLSKKGFATNELEPLTSGSYSTGDNQYGFGLKQAPNEAARGNTTEAAPNHYVKIPFVFRIQGNNGNYHDGKELWLSRAVAKASSIDDGDVYKALRVFVDRDERSYGSWKLVSSDIDSGTVAPEGDLGHAYYLKTDDNKLYAYDSVNTSWDLLVDGITVQAEAPSIDGLFDNEMYINSTDNKLYSKTHSDFILNPSANVAGKTRVGGVLNRNRDVYYDTDSNGEILYGEYDPAALDLISDTGYAGADTVQDINGTGTTEKAWNEIAVATSGNVAPENENGDNGDYYFDTVANKLYKKADDVWSVVTATAAASDPNLASAEIGTLYINTGDFKVYQAGIQASTFVAKHCPGYKYYSNLGSVANDALFKHAQYESISSIAPQRDQYDYLDNADPENPTSVCKTRADDNHLARVTMTVYLEGWDFSVVDKEISHAFDLGLTFEMSRL